MDTSGKIKRSLFSQFDYNEDSELTNIQVGNIDLIGYTKYVHIDKNELMNDDDTENDVPVGGIINDTVNVSNYSNNANFISRTIQYNVSELTEEQEESGEVDTEVATREDIAYTDIDNPDYILYSNRNSQPLRLEDYTGSETVVYEYTYTGNTVLISKNNGEFTISVETVEEDTTETNGKNRTTSTSTYGYKNVDGSESNRSLVSVNETIDTDSITSEDKPETRIQKTTVTSTLITGYKIIAEINIDSANEKSSETVNTLYNSNNTEIAKTIINVVDDTNTNITYKDGKVLKYVFNEDGNITSINSVSDEVEITESSYEYDGLEQLKRENDYRSNQTKIYNYDNGGNILSVYYYNYTLGEIQGEPIKVDTYGYTDSNWKDKLTSFNGNTITYDQMGNPLEYHNGMTFTWTRGRVLESISGNDYSASYKYDQNNIRTYKKVGDVETVYELQDNNIIREIRTNIVTNEVTTIWYIYDGNANVVGLEITDANGTETFYYEKNLQGDITGLYNNLGETVVEYTYDAWGNITSIEGSMSSSVGEINPYRYRGYYYDTESGFYYLQSRYYDAGVGRFLNADDIAFLGASGTIMSHNLYVYCNNNSVMYSDNTGYIAANVIGAAIGATIGIVGGSILGNWLADILNINGWLTRPIFVGSVAALVGAAVGVIGYFIGPYIAKIAVQFGQYVAQLIKKGKLVFKNLSSNVKLMIRTLIEETCCFVAGTAISTPEGLRPIEEIADSYLKKQGLDAHKIKYEILGKKAPISKYNLFYDKATGAIYILKNGAKEVAKIATGYFIK